ncbi:MAG: PilX N-terminal domain-containing pilus assembly protein [Pseudomonadales bacterium]|jgi:type IV pilus assembly protein PilX|nr:PilX N-terminal domain-containing pilus assembly protein [Pseudomonadales bacterium]MDP6471581.1 PilX N-terminal domain-containing pilus assembly protein [Pseudomonadales bacterium]MDP6828844.1 PilX N-terminal domain-containing pilus assembly protein [Pseudomonadales bacterium]MDP6971714.1 PilX N-terminal domain-containing pilus assembly protein [Pseudomonadales bacterium]|tara:strand:+ start:1413 stop:1967 length:555 start_codon:yes stop_codon:yes gene_type:complete
MTFIRKTIRRKEGGVVLFISLVLLLVLTIAGVSAVQTTSLEERMARNSHDTLIAFQAAESALREGERYLEDNVTSTALFMGKVGAGGLWDKPAFGDPKRWEIADVWNGGGSSVEVETAIGGVAEQPRYIIEWIATVQREGNPYLLEESTSGILDRVEVFRVTARGVGGSPTARVLLQSTFGMVF